MVLTYVKIGAALLLLCVAYYLGGLSGKSALSSLKAQQETQVATALQRQAQSTQAETNRLNKVVATYEQTPIDPIAISLGSRVYHHIEASSCPVSKAGANPGGTLSPGPVPAAADPVEPALSAYIEACSRDATRLNALIEAWPR